MFNFVPKPIIPIKSSKTVTEKKENLNEIISIQSKTTNIEDAATNGAYKRLFKNKNILYFIDDTIMDEDPSIANERQRAFVKHVIDPSIMDEIPIKKAKIIIDFVKVPNLVKKIKLVVKRTIAKKAIPAVRPMKRIIPKKTK